MAVFETKHVNQIEAEVPRLVGILYSPGQSVIVFYTRLTRLINDPFFSSKGHLSPTAYRERYKDTIKIIKEEIIFLKQTQYPINEIPLAHINSVLNFLEGNTNQTTLIPEYLPNLIIEEPRKHIGPYNITRVSCFCDTILVAMFANTRYYDSLISREVTMENWFVSLILETTPQKTDMEYAYKLRCETNQLAIASDIQKKVVSIITKLRTPLQLPEERSKGIMYSNTAGEEIREIIVTLKKCGLLNIYVLGSMPAEHGDLIEFLDSIIKILGGQWTHLPLLVQYNVKTRHLPVDLSGDITPIVISWEYFYKIINASAPQNDDMKVTLEYIIREKINRLLLVNADDIDGNIIRIIGNYDALIIQVGRIKEKYDPNLRYYPLNDNRVSIIDKQSGIPHILNIPIWKEILEDGKLQFKIVDIPYEVKSLICRASLDAGMSGHYYVFCEIGGIWYMFDDLNPIFFKVDLKDSNLTEREFFDLPAMKYIDFVERYCTIIFVERKKVP